NQFLEKLLENKYHYSVAIHSKESSYKNEILNIHAHIMFCTREKDEIERTKDNFFKRFNSKNPKLGGCKKNPIWENKDKLLEIRKLWENIQNEYLNKYNGLSKVSCESLEKQKKLAIENGDLLLAKSLDREPVNVDSYLLKKPTDKFTKKDKLKLEHFNLTRETKELSEEILKIERLELERNNSKSILNEIETKLENTSQKKPTHNMNNDFDTFNQTMVDIKNCQKSITNLERQLNNLETTSYNILTKGKYSKLQKSLTKNNLDIDSFNTKIKHNIGTKKEIQFLKYNIEKLLASNIEILSEIESIKKSYLDPNMKNKKIRIEKSFELKLIEKLTIEKARLLDKEKIAEIIHKTALKTTPEHIDDYIVVKNEEALKSNLNGLKYEKISEHFKNINFDNLERLALNKLTGGVYFKIMNEYNLLKAKKLKINLELDTLTGLKTKIFNFKKIQFLKRELNLVQNNMNSLDLKFKNIQNTIGDQKLYDEILILYELNKSIQNKFSKKSESFVLLKKNSEELVKFAKIFKKQICKNIDKSNLNQKNVFVNLRGKILGNYNCDIQSKNKDFDIDFS
ncbi:MAG: MobA/MobL family protein, partial [Cetobacterium sp.]